MAAFRKSAYLVRVEERVYVLGEERGSQGGGWHMSKDFSFTYTHSLPVSLVINFNLFIP